MTKEQLLDNLRLVYEETQGFSRDIENQHKAADSFLLAYIGDKEISDAFDKIEKWYA